MKSPWDGKACRSFGKNTKWTLPFMAMSITMKEHAPYTRYIKIILTHTPSKKNLRNTQDMIHMLIKLDVIVCDYLTRRTPF